MRQGRAPRHTGSLLPLLSLAISPNTGLDSQLKRGAIRISLGQLLAMEANEVAHLLVLLMGDLGMLMTQDLELRVFVLL